MTAAAKPIRQSNPLVVAENEQGQKILQFLHRRLDLPETLLHRWIRTGQVRIDSGRCKPFDRIKAGSHIRVPPFALTMPDGVGAIKSSMDADSATLHIVARHADILVLDKPAGLPTHPGTGHDDSIATRLKGMDADEGFSPTPAHRLDKDTSGILLVARSYLALRHLQQCLKDRNIIKEYVAWVHGRWPWPSPHLLEGQLCKSIVGAYEKMVCLTQDDGNAKGRLAQSLVTPLVVGETASLLHIRLLTGRTHQIRVQLANAGHPIVNDTKYGPSPTRGEDEVMLLHALRICLPDGRFFACLPSWQDKWKIDAMPPFLESKSFSSTQNSDTNEKITR